MERVSEQTDFYLSTNLKPIKSLNFNLKLDTLSKILTSLHKKVYFFVQKNNLYYQYAEASADGKGQLFFRIPPETYYLSSSCSVSQNMMEIKVLRL
ncbi:MAG: hypothetical protein IEMM0008_1867 [bacterium]|nr:MAG: hypothetical protein IEMM0008_1867 [bacterium]